MKTLFIVLLFCGTAISACTSPCVQAKSCTGTTSPVTCAFTANPTSGNLVTAFVIGGIAATTLGASDSVNGTYNAVGVGHACGGGTACFGELFYFCNSGTGSDTVTVTGTGTVAALQVIIAEWSGITASNCLDNSAYAGNASGTSQATPNLTDTNANDLIIAAEANNGNGGTKSVGAPYTSDGATTTTKMAGGWQTVSSTSVTGATFTFQFAASPAVVTASFIQSGGATPCSNFISLLGAGCQ